MQIAISQTIKNEVKDYFYITLGLLIYTFGWTIFLLPYQIVTGGVTGIAAVIYYGTGIPIYLSYFLINAALLLAALKILGFKFMVKTIYAIIMLSVFLALAQDWMIGENGKMVQVLGEGQDFMSLIIGCLFTGLSLAVVFLHNGSTGGTDIIAAIVNKVFDSFPQQLSEYVAGGDKLHGFFVGETMRASGGKANPKLVNDTIRGEITKRRG